MGQSQSRELDKILASITNRMFIRLSYTDKFERPTPYATLMVDQDRPTSPQGERMVEKQGPYVETYRFQLGNFRSDAEKEPSGDRLGDRFQPISSPLEVLEYDGRELKLSGTSLDNQRVIYLTIRYDGGLWIKGEIVRYLNINETQLERIPLELYSDVSVRRGVESG